MTYDKCLCDGESAEIINYDNPMCCTLSKNPDYQDFGQYEGKVLTFIRQQIKSRENECLCDENAPVNNCIGGSECDETRNCMLENHKKISLYTWLIIAILIAALIAIILHITARNGFEFCIPVKVDKIPQTKFF